MQRLRRLLVALSGAREEILDLCPSEWVKFESLGWAILITSGMATVSMWFALSSAMGINGLIAIPVAVLWGLVIMGIDRWLITSMPIEGRRKFMIAAPRFLLAVLLGTLISTPLVLRVFESEINAQISVIKQQRYSNFLADQQNSKVAQQVNNLRNQVSSLEKVIDTGGAAALNPSADPQVASLDSQLKYWQGQERYYYGQWQCQLYGGAGCTVQGNGPLAQAMHADYLNAVAKTNTIQGEITQRDSQLASTSAAEEKSRYDQAVTALPGVRQQLAVAQARQSALQANFYAQDQATNGILIRLQALSQLSNGDFTVTAARFLLFLLFLVIEILPVTVKLLQRPGIYEEALQAKQAVELGNAKRVLRGRSQLTANGANDGSTRFLQLEVEPTGDVHSIWNQSIVPPRHHETSPDDERTQTIRQPRAPRDPREVWQAGRDQARRAEADRDHDPDAAGPRRDGGYQSDPYLGQTRADDSRQGETRRDPVNRPEPRLDGHSGDSGEMPVLDQTLRAMEDADTDGHGDGIPLRWDDE